MASAALDATSSEGHVFVEGLREDSFEKAETQGFIKMTVDAEKKQILGTRDDEVVHVLPDVLYEKASYAVIQRARYIHPNIAEYLPNVLYRREPM